MAYNVDGFKPIQNLTGKIAILQKYKVSAAADKAYFPGDPVRLKATGRVTNFAASTTAADAVIGVVQSVYSSGAANGYGGRPLTFQQPTNGNFLTTGTPGWVEVNVDKDQVYLAKISTTASAGLIGNTVRVSAGTPNTRIGRSGYNLAAASLGTGADGPFKVVGVGDDLTGALTDKAPPAALKVVLNSTVFTNLTGI